MAKIIIIGAGLGGLAFAYKYRGDAEIKIYEKRSRDKLGFPWHDSVKAEIFDDLALPIPCRGVCGKKPFDIYSPSVKGYVPQRQKTVSLGYEINRVALINHFIDLASHSAKIEFEKEVVAIERGLVTFEDGTQESCDLIIDASGGFSPFRKFFLEDEKDFEPSDDEILYCYRAAYKIPDGAFVEERDSVYLKRIVSAVSWCRTAPETNCMDVFISSLGSPLTKELIEEVEEDIRARHPSVSREAVSKRAERLALRAPLAQMVFDGYAAVGDSAYAANPTNGCGIENALRSGCMLADALKNAKDFSVETLWNYQVKFTRELGSDLLALDVFKRWIFKVPSDDVAWLFDSVIGEEIVKYLTDETDAKSFNPKLFLSKIPVAFGRKDILSEGVKVLTTAGLAKGFAMLIPSNYDKKLVTSWKKRYNGYINTKN